MVSTRGPRYKFSEGERVLCYEPDPTKAKVLYDSKVLEVIERKNKRGRRSVEYLIHFQGWNSSWDRCVGEELVLKDTEGNRQLQRALADKAQLHIGAYLYRRERKKAGSGSSATGTGSATGKKPRIAEFDDDGESSVLSSPEDEGNQSEDSCRGSVSTGGNSSSCEESDSSDDEEDCNSEGQPSNAIISIGPALRQRLTLDYELVVCGGRLMRLPCKPNALQLLEGCVKHHSTRAVANHTPPPPHADLQEQVRRLNILREVADGLRIYLDFILRDQLLYDNEKQQYHQAVADGILKDTLPLPSPAETKDDDEGSTVRGYPEDYAHLPPSPRLLDEPETHIKSEPSSPHANPRTHQNPHSPTWEDLRIKTDGNTSDTSKATSREDYPTNSRDNLTWENNCNQELSNETQQRRNSPRVSRESPLRRYPSRDTRHSSCNSEPASDSQLGDNSDAGSTLSSAEGSRSDTRMNDEDSCQMRPRSETGEEWKDMEEQSMEHNEESGSVRQRVSSREGGADCDETTEGRCELEDATEQRPSKERSPGRPNFAGNGTASFARGKYSRISRMGRLRSQRPRSRTLDDQPPAPLSASLSAPFNLPGPSNMSNNIGEVPVAELNGGITEEFKQALDWRIVPPDHPPYPTAVYGAIHLARLFVKLPEYLNVINMPESKLELIIEYVEYFAQYLEEHEEWFGESFYCESSSPAPS